VSEEEITTRVEKVIEALEEWAGQLLVAERADFIYRQVDELRAAIGKTVKVQHVVPINDLFDHDTSGAGCLCGPELNDDGSMGFIVIHRSLDGRETTGGDK